MLDSRRVKTTVDEPALDVPALRELILRMPGDGTELRLREGVQAIARDARGLYAATDGGQSLVRFCLDRRGVWLTVASDAGNVHVNGRQVRRMAMLRVGDAIFVDGLEMVLARPGAPEQPDGEAYDDNADALGDIRVLLRGLGGKQHGRSFTLEQPRLIGSAADADIRIDDPVFAERHAQISLLGGRVVLRDLGSADGSLLNGHPVRDAWVSPGDQLVFDTLHRFVLEAPGASIERLAAAPLHDGMEDPVASPVPRAGWRRWPWLLLAALLTAGALAALLMFGHT